MKALIVIDVQNDFCEGGALAVAGGLAVAKKVRQLIDNRELDAYQGSPEYSPKYQVLIATRDWHIDPGAHFAEQPDYLDTWPSHCVAETEGAALACGLSIEDFDAIFDKGAYTAAYSGFEGNYGGAGPKLADWLHEHHITEVDVCGIATDYCVKATALDAARAGFKTTVLRQICAAVHPEQVEVVYDELRAAKIEVI